MENVRIISGNVLTGKQVDIDGFLGFYHSSFSVIEESFERPFIGWLHPGGKSKYSVFNAYLGSNKKVLILPHYKMEVIEHLFLLMHGRKFFQWIFILMH